MNSFIQTCCFGLLLFLATCNNGGIQENKKLTGTIEKTGITTYQYGTHTLTTEANFYAIKSKNIDLDQYIGEKVNVEYKKVEGYPIDGGPEYLEILAVE